MFWKHLCGRSIFLYWWMYLEKYMVSCLVFFLSVWNVCAHKSYLIMNSVKVFLSSQPPEQISCWCNKIRVSSHSRTDGLRRAMRRLWHLSAGSLPLPCACLSLFLPFSKKHKCAYRLKCIFFLLSNTEEKQTFFHNTNNWWYFWVYSQQSWAEWPILLYCALYVVS